MSDAFTNAVFALPLGGLPASATEHETMRMIRGALSKRGIVVSKPGPGSGGGSWVALDLGSCSITLGVGIRTKTDTLAEMFAMSWHNESFFSRRLSWRQHQTEECATCWRNLLDAFEDAVVKDLGATCFRWVPREYDGRCDEAASGGPRTG